MAVNIADMSKSIEISAIVSAYATRRDDGVTPERCIFGSHLMETVLMREKTSRFSHKIAAHSSATNSESDVHRSAL